MGEATVKIKDQYAPASQQVAAPFMAPEEFTNTFARVLQQVMPELAGIAAIYIIMSLFTGRRKKDNDVLEILADAVADKVVEKLKAKREVT
jgi:mannose/fructose/N-acetylgalactosamine-specific phosphotransferase system component IID